MNNNIPFEPNNRTTTSRKKTYLGILRGIGYNINYIIGIDAFNPGNLWMLVHSPGITLVFYIVCFFISLLGSSVYIELGIRSLPSGIGEQKYISDAFYPIRNFGYVFSFVAIFIMFPSLIVAESYNSARYFLYCFRRNLNVDWITVIVAIAILFIITLYQLYSNKLADYVNQTLAIFKIIILLIISVIGLVKLNTNSFNWINIFDVSLFYDFGTYGRGLIKVLFSYEGWNNINYLIGEFHTCSDDLKYPSLILKYSSLISVFICFIICCLTNAAFITVVGYNSNNSIDNELMPMRFGQELFGENGENFMAILVAISTFGCISALIFTYVRRLSHYHAN